MQQSIVVFRIILLGIGLGENGNTAEDKKSEKDYFFHF
jgi:hypothetical protein